MSLPRQPEKANVTTRNRNSDYFPNCRTGTFGEDKAKDPPGPLLVTPGDLGRVAREAALQALALFVSEGTLPQGSQYSVAAETGLPVAETVHQDFPGTSRSHHRVDSGSSDGVHLAHHIYPVAQRSILDQ